MGLLVDGVWHTDWYNTKATGGKFVRQDSAFRSWVTSDGSAGPTGRDGYKAEAGRYHLYVSLACPWAHRTLIFLALKGLHNSITVSVVNAIMRDEGWTFAPGDGVVPDSVNHKQRLYEIYQQAMPDYSGRVTVPVLWDKQTQTIVNNESSEIIRMLNSAFDGIGALPGDYYPEDLREKIDSINERIYHGLNNGVYKAGFATDQQVYNNEVTTVFETLDYLEELLSAQRYLAGNRLTEADWRAFTTLIRFDAVYVGHFKCNRKRLADYPALSNYLRELYQYPGVSETVNIDYTKAHYYGSHETINPTLIIPAGPELDFDAPHNREQIGIAA